MRKDQIPARDDPEFPEELGIYRIESLLGRGGMGEVYLAWDTLLERHVAIKRVRIERGDDPHQRARFLREARAVARLDHPAIVRIHHIFEREAGDCLVMEYVPGRDLSRLLGSEELDPRRVAAIGQGIADGLAEAHACGLVHRDLKLANVMIDARGRVKILDFGLAKTLAARSAESEPLSEPQSDPLRRQDRDQVTQPGMLVGTVHAMSPEQAIGDDVDHRSDLFALGSLLYELLAGEAPFRGRSILDSLRKVATEDPVPITERVPDLPAGFDELIGELLAKDPDARPASTRRVAERLAHIAEGAATGSGPDVQPGRADDHFEASPDSPTLESPSPLTPEAATRAADSSGPILRTLLAFGPVEDADQAAVDVVRRRALARLDRFNGRPAADGCLVFERPAEAVALALELQRSMAADRIPDAAIGVDLGEVVLHGPSTPPGDRLARDLAPLVVDGPPVELARRLASRARPRQILLGRAAFDLARGARAPEILVGKEVRWLDHGRYSFGADGLELPDEPLEICEVGLEGSAPLRPPADDSSAHRVLVHGEEPALGWRPATGQGVPRRANWRLAERLGEGGFGEVWLARHKSGEERVFKFCFEPERLRALQREVTLFRLLRESLGHRSGIARVLDWDFEEVPYFLESEYTDGGDLVRWAERRGGIASVPRATRLELVAEVADALAAAHSVGVLHKDVKPRNVLIGHDDDGRPRARLTDLGVGHLTDRSALVQPGFTVLGFTEATLDDGATHAGGTVQYMAPELIEGKPATIQADVYALGVLLYQIVVGDFDRALAQGWRRQIDDPLLQEDIAACVDGAADRRLQSPAQLAERLRALDARREEQRRAERAASDQARALRRRRIAGWAGVAAAVLLPIVSIFAYHTVQAKNRELDARQQAEQRRGQAEKLIDFLLGDLRAELEPIDKLSILDQVGDQAMEYFAAVAEDELSDEELAHYAEALHQIGQVRFGLGKVTEAADAFEASLDKAQRLASRDPENTDWQFQLGQSHFWVGFMRWKERDLPAALEQFEAYRTVSRRLVERDPSNETWQLELAYAHSNFGSVFEEQGRLAEAGDALETAARTFEGLLQRSPDDPQIRLDLAHLYEKLGQVLLDRGELAAARARFEAALDIFRRAFADDPDDLQIRAVLNGALFHVAKVLLFQGDTDGALASLRSAEEHSRALVAHDPDNRTWRARLLIDLRELGRTHLALGDPESARPLIAEAGELVEELRSEAPEHVRWRFAKAVDDWCLAGLASLRGDAGEARRRSERALDELRSIDADNLTTSHLQWTARTLESLGDALDEVGDHDRAEEVWREGIELAQELVATEPTPVHLEALVRLLLRLEEREEAEPILRRLDAIGYRHVAYLAFLELHGPS